MVRFEPGRYGDTLKRWKNDYGPGGARDQYAR